MTISNLYSMAKTSVIFANFELNSHIVIEFTLSGKAIQINDCFRKTGGIS